MGHGMANESVTAFKKTLKSKDLGKRQISSIRGLVSFTSTRGQCDRWRNCATSFATKAIIGQIVPLHHHHANLIAEIRNSKSWRSGPKEDEERRKNKRKRKNTYQRRR